MAMPVKLLICIFGLLVGCVTLTEEQKEQRDYKYEERVAQDRAAMEKCRRYSGRVRFEGYGGIGRLTNRTGIWQCDY